MSHNDLDQFKRMLRALAALLLIVGMSLIFLYIWRSYYNLGVVFPFYSHCGGALGNIRADIAALCPGAEVREALGILQVGQTNLLQEIQSWLETAGIPLQMAAALSF